MRPSTLSLSDVKARLSEVVRSVRQTGEPLVITVDGQPAAQICSWQPPERKLSRVEIATSRALMESLKRIARPAGTFDAVAAVAEGRR